VSNRKDIDKPSSYRAPRYWPVWLLFFLLRLISLLPESVLRFIGGGLGMLAYRLVPSRRRVARINIRQAYPDFTDQQVAEFNKISYRNTGISMLETSYAWLASDRYLRSRFSVEGMQHLDAAIAQGKGVILLTGHFTTLEIGGRLMGLQLEQKHPDVVFNGVYKRAHDPAFNALMLHCRLRYGDELFENTDVRAVIRGLRKGAVTWFAPDQDFADQEVVFTPFLGGIASTLTATAKMARLTGAPVVPYYPMRVDKGYKMVVLPALEDFPGDDIEAASARVNRAIEEMVYACPEQYLWSHKRFKTQPDRKTNIYA
jgi:KDO2-lipid IV(A) lauroyltransferase